ncbi:clarin-3 [Rhynchocyon petersi]
MPTRMKILTFLSSFFTSLGSFIVICSILATQAWIRSTFSISDDISNGNVTVSYGLFRGESSQELTQGLQEPNKYFEVLAILSESSPRILHLVVILFLVLGLFSSLLSSGFTMYNSISNPYQTFLGPVGVYTWNGLCASFTLLAMFLFVGNTQSNGLSEELTQLLYPTFTRKGVTHQYGYSFWLLLLVILLNIVTAVIILFYQKARYRQKQEQRKPMEQAPRDGILF